MKILVTGSAGFIGYHLCKKLLSEGHIVIGIDNHSADYDISLKESHTEELQKFKNFRFIKYDLVNDNFPNLEGEKIDSCIHLVSKEFFYEHPENIDYTSYLESNVITTSNAFKLAKSLNTKKFIFLSTFSVYGVTKKEDLVERKLLPTPISPHGASKLAAEQAVKYLNRLYYIPAVILRLSTVYGPHMTPYTIIPYFIDRLLEDKPIDIFHKKEQKRDFIYIDDVINYITLCLTKRLQFQVINIGSGKSVSLAEIGKLIAKELGKSGELKFAEQEEGYRRVLVENVNLNVTKAARIIKYKPAVGLEEGIKRTVNWYLNNKDILKKSVRSD